MNDLSSIPDATSSTLRVTSKRTSIETVDTWLSSSMSNSQSSPRMKGMRSSGHWRTFGASKDYLYGTKVGNSFFHTAFEDGTSTSLTIKGSKESIPESMPKNFQKMMNKEASFLSDNLSNLETISNGSSQSMGSIMSRQEDKSVIQELNNRLAAYMDNVRNLKHETNELRLKLKICEENKTQNIAKVKALYTNRIEELEKAIESMNRHCSKLKLGTEGLIRDNQNLESLLDKKEAELSNSIEMSLKLEDENRKLCDRLMCERDENKRARIELTYLLPHHQETRAKVRELVVKLENERLKTSDLETKTGHIEKDFELKRSVLETELLVMKEQHIDEKQRLKENYDNQLEKEMEELRLSCENSFELIKSNIVLSYEEKIRKMETDIVNERAEIIQILEDNKDFRNESQDLTRTIFTLKEELQSKNNILSKMYSEREKEIEDYHEVVKTKDDEIECLRKSLVSQNQAKDELEEANMNLDMEIAT